ncbi:MAG: hypothetical protein AAFZ07_03205 [Actinomycetota bacterium]
MPHVDEAGLDGLGRAAVELPPSTPSPCHELQARVRRRRSRRRRVVASTCAVLVAAFVVAAWPSDGGRETIVAAPPSSDSALVSGTGDALWPAAQISWSLDELLAATAEDLLRWPASTTWQISGETVEGATIVTGQHPSNDERRINLLVADDGSGWRIVETLGPELIPVLDDGRLTGLRSSRLAGLADAVVLGPLGPLDAAIWDSTVGTDPTERQVVLADPIEPPVGGAILVVSYDIDGEAIALSGLAFGDADRFTADLDQLFDSEPAGAAVIVELVERAGGSLDAADVRALLDLDDAHDGYVALVDGEVCWYVHARAAEHLASTCVSEFRFNRRGVTLSVGGPTSSITAMLVPERAEIGELPPGFRVHPSGAAIVDGGPGELLLDRDLVVGVVDRPGAD